MQTSQSSVCRREVASEIGAFRVWRHNLEISPPSVSARNPLLPAEPLASTFCRVLTPWGADLQVPPGGQHPDGGRLWWHRWLCARPSPEGLGPVAAQAGPAEAGVGRLGLGEDGRGETRRKQLGRQDPGLRPVGRCHLQCWEP